MIDKMYEMIIARECDRKASADQAPAAIAVAAATADVERFEPLLGNLRLQIVSTNDELLAVRALVDSSSSGASTKRSKQKP